MESGHVILLAHPRVHQPGSSPKPTCPEFFGGFHYVGMVDWIIGQVRELNLQPTSSSWRLRGCANITVAQRLNYLTTWLVFWSWPVSIRNHLLSINSDVVQRPTVNNKDTPHHWGNSKNLVFPQGTGDKCQSRVLLYNSWILQLPKKLFKEMSMPGSHQEFSFNWSGVQPEYKDF